VIAVRIDGPAFGFWDRSRIEQVVSNLVANALKYGGGRPVAVEVGAADGKARLTVRDEGIGIPVDQQARIFERFERAVSSRHFGGLGLGLYIVRQIVDSHGGHIEVESEPDAGSTFTVTLPLQPPVTAEAEAPAPVA
jgi:signal transduction histidine kinase